jgi:Tol biopolymer transport system component
MAPEQLEGKEADARSDIFALGAVLYEMATGRRAFEGKSQTSVIAAILEREPPPISSLQPMSPPQLDRVVKLCLAKDADERLQSAHDVKLQLEWIRDAGSQAGVPAPVAAHRKHRERIAWATAALLAIGFGLAIVGYIARAPQSGPAIISEISPPANSRFTFGGDAASVPTISPNGRRLALSAVGTDGRQLLWVRPLDSATSEPLSGTEDATFPFWSPDGHDLGFFANRKLNRIDASGGPPLSIADASTGRGGSWGADGTILFTPDTTSPIYRVLYSGGTPQQVTKMNTSRHEVTHRWPQFLPDGKHFLFYAHCNDPQNNATYAASLDGGEPKLIVRGDSNAVYAPPGYLLFVREGTLMGQRFNADRMSLSGDATPLGEHVEVNAIVWRGIFSLSENGILDYAVGTAGGYGIFWYDRSGKQTAQTSSSGDYHDPRISPDGRKLAYTIIAPGTSTWTIVVYDLARGVGARLTFSSSINRGPTWSPDGKSIAFVSNQNGLTHIYQKASDGTGSTLPLVVDNVPESYPSFSSDGRYLVFERLATTSGAHTEIWALPLSGDRKPFPVLQNQEYDVFQPSLSPDSKWLAYTSLESGRREIYVVPFRQGSGKWLVSPDGGYWPRWRRDCKELFYMSTDHKIMSAEISEAGSSVVIGKVAPLFQSSFASSAIGWTYDVSADGREFVVVSQVVQQVSAPLTLVTNWPALLKKSP